MIVYVIKVSIKYFIYLAILCVRATYGFHYNQTQNVTIIFHHLMCVCVMYVRV